MGIRYRKGKDGVKRAYGSFMHNRVRHDGHPLCEWTDGRHEPGNAKEAQIAFEKFKAACRAGTVSLPKDIDRNMSIAQFAVYYQDRYMDRKGRTSDACTIHMIGDYFGNRPISIFGTHTAFQELKAYLQDTPIPVVKVFKKDGQKVIERVKSKRFRKPATINRFLKRCQHMCNFAVAHKLIDQNPFLGDSFTDLIGYEDEPEGRGRGVTADEEDRLFANASTEMTERMEIAFLFGVRRGEMQRAQLKDLNFDEWLWTIPGFKEIDGEKVRNTKNGKERVVPIPDLPKIRTLFTGKRKLFNKDAFLFGEAGVYVASFNTAWNNLKDAGGLDDATLAKQGRTGLHWHDLRGEAATRLMRQGYSAELIAEIAGNTPAVIRKHYKGELLDAMRTALTGTR